MNQLIVRLSYAAALGALGTGCQSPSADVGAFRTVADTVGDTIVMHITGNPEGAGATLVPELRIGVPEGDSAYIFGKVSGLAPSAEGGVYVWDELSKSLRQYDRSGRFVRQLGRAGRGPGEYTSIAGMALVGEELIFFDRSTQHVNVYDSAGTLATSWLPAYPRGPMGQLYPGTGGRIWLWHLLENPESNPAGGLKIGYIEYSVRGEATGDAVPRLRFGPEDGPPVIRASGMRMGRQVMTVDMVPFTAEPLDAFSPYGYLVSGKGDRYSVLLSRRRAPPVRIERTVTPVPVSDDERAEAEARTTARMRTIDPRWTWNGIPIPDHKPFFRRLRIDADGRIWVERTLASIRMSHSIVPARDDEPPPSHWREPVAYDVFGADGSLLGTVPVPEHASLRYLQCDRVWGVVRDSLDIDYVVRWRLEPSLCGADRRVAAAR
ncbi:MAG TPA: 6-bladed beta-propeller [Gemmatimonadaceae bacterium]